ncbi:hypothetical protein H0H81_003237 [Sphagnurus paluster]|uniref:Uncharacterized protein n=1 Tax=Sphagnurus paluster TaxID=117069 RepID=A0A9P7GQI0_9AGAR|nr:hypothetical protein H0H81_003237 [Sphagnurus paluster]
MNATIESLFGPPSEPVDIPAFIEAAVALNTSDSGFSSEEITDKCSVADLRDALFDTWNNPTLSAYLSKDHDHTVTSLYSAIKSSKNKRKANLPEPDSLPPEVAALQKSLESAQSRIHNLHQAFKELRPKCSCPNRMCCLKQFNKHLILLKMPAPEPSTHLSDEEIKAILTVSIHTRSTWTSGYVNRSSQHALLSSQTLGDIFRIFPCTSKEIVNDDFVENPRLKGGAGCVICIDDLAYGDGSSGEDYAE